MDWSDDIAYSVHDLEDAVVAGHLRLAALRDADDRTVLAALTCARVDEVEAVEAAEVLEALDRLLAMPWWPSSYDGSHRSLAALKNLSSQLIGRFCQAAEHATRAAFAGSALNRYAADLVVPRGTRLEVEVLKAVADRYVMSRADAARRYADQRSLVLELADALLRTAPFGLDPLLRDDFRVATDDAGRLRVVVDQVAQLTDTSATALHAQLTRPGG